MFEPGGVIDAVGGAGQAVCGGGARLLDQDGGEVGDGVCFLVHEDFAAEFGSDEGFLGLVACGVVGGAFVGWGGFGWFFFDEGEGVGGFVQASEFA